MAYQQEPIYFPKVPFTGSIQGGLQEGQTIIISGRVLPNAQWFNVNLQCGSNADIALHFNPRYKDGALERIVINTFKNDKWQTEKIVQQALFKPQSNFILKIVVNQNFYKISVNGAHFMDYNHLIPFNKVDTILVNGMVEYHSIVFQNPAGNTTSKSTTSKSVPYKTIIDGGLHPGKTIYIQGVVNPQAHSFAFNLRHRGGIAFHYCPWVNENKVKRNTMLGETWDTNEENTGPMPFIKGQLFQVAIICEPSKFNVFVNGIQPHTYNHRFTKLAEIDVLEICGDLTLTSVVM